MSDQKPDPGPEIPGKCNTVKKDGTRCRRPAGWNTDHKGAGHCANHLGTTANHRAHAQRLLAEREITRLGLTLVEAAGDHARIDAREVLALELWRTHVNVTVLEQLVSELGTDQLYGKLYHADGGETGRALPHVLVTMYEEERRHLVNVAAAAARAGVEERRAQIEQDKALLVADVIRKAIDAIDGLTAIQRQQAMVGAAGALRALPGGQA